LTSQSLKTRFCIGLLVTVIGGYWDAVWHLEGYAAQEGFLTPAHATIYGGVLLMIITSIQWHKTSSVNLATLDPWSRYGFLAGSLLMAGGGAWDFAYHSIHGFVDVVAWTPPHLTVTAGFVVVFATAVKTLWHDAATLVRTSLTLTAFLFAALWATVVTLSLF
jgi:hypothetical protein